MVSITSVSLFIIWLIIYHTMVGKTQGRSYWFSPDKIICLSSSSPQKLSAIIICSFKVEEKKLGDRYFYLNLYIYFYEASKSQNGGWVLSGLSCICCGLHRQYCAEEPCQEVRVEGSGHQRLLWSTEPEHCPAGRLGSVVKHHYSQAVVSASGRGSGTQYLSYFNR